MVNNLVNSRKLDAVCQNNSNPFSFQWQPVGVRHACGVINGFAKCDANAYYTYVCAIYKQSLNYLGHFVNGYSGKIFVEFMSSYSL